MNQTQNKKASPQNIHMSYAEYITLRMAQIGCPCTRKHMQMQRGNETTMLTIMLEA